MPTKRLKRLFPRLGCGCLSLLIMLAALEIALRLFIFGTIHVHRPERYRDFDPILGWRLQPNASVIVQDPEYTITIQTNAHGLRDVEHNWQKGDGVFRILILGDSFMEAYQVELAESLPRLLEHDLNTHSYMQIEVINMGMGGYSTAQEYLLFMQQGRRYQPDLVLLAFFPFNDVATNTYPLASRLMTPEDYKLVAAPFASLNPAGELQVEIRDLSAARQIVESAQARTQKQAVLESSVLAEQTRAIWHRIDLALQREATIRDIYHVAILRDGLWFNVYGCDQDADWAGAWAMTERLILALQAESASIGADFAVMMIPSRFEVSSTEWSTVLASYDNVQASCTDIKLPAQRIGALGVPMLDLQPIFRDWTAAHGDHLYFTKIDRHWTAQGHAVAAEALGAWLLEETIIP